MLIEVNKKTVVLNMGDEQSNIHKSKFPIYDGSSSYQDYISAEGNEGKTKDDYLAHLKGEKGDVNIEGVTLKSIPVSTPITITGKGSITDPITADDFNYVSEHVFSDSVLNPIIRKAHQQGIVKLYDKDNPNTKLLGVSVPKFPITDFSLAFSLDDGGELKHELKMSNYIFSMFPNATVSGKEEIFAIDMNYCLSTDKLGVGGNARDIEEDILFNKGKLYVKVSPKYQIEVVEQSDNFYINGGGWFKFKIKDLETGEYVVKKDEYINYSTGCFITNSGVFQHIFTDKEALLANGFNSGSNLATAEDLENFKNGIYKARFAITSKINSGDPLTAIEGEALSINLELDFLDVNNRRLLEIMSMEMEVNVTNDVCSIVDDIQFSSTDDLGQTNLLTVNRLNGEALLVSPMVNTVNADKQLAYASRKSTFIPMLNSKYILFKGSPNYYFLTTVNARPPVVTLTKEFKPESFHIQLSDAYSPLIEVTDEYPKVVSYTTDFDHKLNANKPRHEISFAFKLVLELPERFKDKTFDFYDVEVTKTLNGTTLTIEGTLKDSNDVPGYLDSISFGLDIYSGEDKFDKDFQPIFVRPSNTYA